MTSKEKATELYNKIKNNLTWIEKDYNVDIYRDSKEIAKICVQEIIEARKNLPNERMKPYWQEVLDYLNEM